RPVCRFEMNITGRAAYRLSQNRIDKPADAFGTRRSFQSGEALLQVALDQCRHRDFLKQSFRVEQRLAAHGCVCVLGASAMQSIKSFVTKVLGIEVQVSVMGSPAWTIPPSRILARKPPRWIRPLRTP